MNTTASNKVSQRQDRKQLAHPQKANSVYTRALRLTNQGKTYSRHVTAGDKHCVTTIKATMVTRGEGSASARLLGQSGPEKHSHYANVTPKLLSVHWVIPLSVQDSSKLRNPKRRANALNVSRINHSSQIKCLQLPSNQQSRIRLNRLS